MSVDKDGLLPLDFIALHDRIRPKLQRIAEHWSCGDVNAADEAVQDVLVQAWTNPNRLPTHPVAAERWLIASLRFAIRRVRSRHGRHCIRGRAATPTFAHTLSKNTSGTAEHYVAVAAAVSQAGGDDQFDEMLAGLDVHDRQLLVDGVNDESDDWERRKDQAVLRAKLLPLAPKSSGVTPRSRITDFVRFCAEIRNWEAPESYISAYRVLERKTGGWLRLRDLDDAFLGKYILPRSLSSRKRLLAVWNAAASMGVIKPPPKHARQSVAPHPVHWSADDISKAIRVAEKMQGVVGITAIPKREYWPALISLAADSGLSFSDLLELTWDRLRLNEGFKHRAKPQTVEFLRTVQQYGHELVFPWNGAKEVFYKYYGRLVRESGLATDCLTPREWDVLRGTAEGGTEKFLAERFGCSVSNIRDYRKRLREKLNIRGTWSIKKLVATARERGLIPEVRC